ncbi:hypothetical protein D3C84_911510 [compost metagenome]
MVRVASGRLFGADAEQWGIGRTKRLRHHIVQPFCGHRLNLAEAGQHLRIMMLDRRRNVAREHFGRIVEQRHRGRPVRVQRLAEQPVANLAQHVRQQSDMERMLRDTLARRIAHQAPALNILQSVHIRKKIAVHRVFSPLSYEYPADPHVPVSGYLCYYKA